MSLVALFTGPAPPVTLGGENERLSPIRDIQTNILALADHVYMRKQLKNVVPIDQIPLRINTRVAPETERPQCDCPPYGPPEHFEQYFRLRPFPLPWGDNL